MNQEVHTRLAQATTNIGATKSTFRNTVSSHVLPDSVSFKNMEDVRKHVKDEHAAGVRLTDYVATLGDELILSVRVNNVSTVPVAHKDSSNAQNKKRKRGVEAWSENMIDIVAKAVERTRKSHPHVSQEELDQARLTLTRIVTLRGASEEDLVQSFGIFRKQLNPSDSKQTLLLAIRLNAGVAVSVSDLKNAMGKCWADGVITSQDSALGIGSVDLPLSPEGETAKAHGNLPVLIVSAVRPPSSPSSADTTLNKPSGCSTAAE